jgi:hypothetical protein
MTFKQYLATMGGATILAGILLAVIVIDIDPQKTLTAVFGVFYACLLLALTGLFSLLGLALRIWLLGQEKRITKHVWIAFRQAVLISIIIVIMLALGRHGFLGWLNFALLLGVATLLEFFFVSLQHHQPRLK